MQNLHISGVDLNLALVLHALLTEKSVSRAGKRLGLSQSATSHALARLRNVLGDPLVIRTRHGVSPTSRAETIAEPLGAAIALLERALLPPATFEPSTAVRRFRIGATDYAELLLLPKLIATLDREAPRVDVWMRPFGEGSIADLRRGELDLVVGVVSPGDVPSSVRTRRLLDDRLVCVVRRGHPLARGRLTLARFAAAKHALVAPRAKPGGPVDDALAARGLERRVAVAIPHFLVAPHVVAETDVVLTLAERIARHFARLLPLRVLEPPLDLPPVQLSMLWHERHDVDPGHAWIRETLARLTGRR